MSSTSYSFSSSSTMIENDEDCTCSMKRSVTAERNKDVWNVSCIFIDCDKSSWHASLMTFLILYDSIHLWFSFLNDRSVFMFLMNNHTSFLITYSDESVLFWSTYLFWIFWVCANFFLMKFQMFFIFSAIITAFCASTRSLTDDRSWETSLFEFDEWKLIRGSNS